MSDTSTSSVSDTFTSPASDTSASSVSDTFTSPASGAPAPAASEVPAPHLPVWLLEQEDYAPSRDHEGFLKRNTLKLTSMLSRVKMQRGGLVDAEDLSPIDRALTSVDPALRLGGVFVCVLCTAIARNMFFVYCMLGVVLVILAFRSGDEIIDTCKPALGATALAAIVMIPAIFIGQPTSLVRVALKVLVSVTLLTGLSRGVAWNEIIAGMRFYHIPSMMVFIFDMTIKYIVLLGQTASDVLEALNLRSIGHNAHKSESASNVMGVTFLKAHDYGAEMYQAMECRGFVGDYLIPRHRILNGSGIIYLIVIAAVVALLIYLERAL